MDLGDVVKLNRRLGTSIGWQIKRYVPDILEARVSLINKLSPDLIIDGGANRGQYSKELRDYIPSIPILAFEPVQSSFKVLEELKLANFEARCQALSSKRGETTINVLGNLGMSSSIGAPNDDIKKIYPDLTTGHVEKILTERLDSLDDLAGKGIYLKLDVEGHEWQALQGAKALFERGQIVALELETCITPAREGERGHYELVNWLSKFGLKVHHLFAPAVARDGMMNFLDTILIKV